MTDLEHAVRSLLCDEDQSALELAEQLGTPLEDVYGALARLEAEERAEILTQTLRYRPRVKARARIWGAL